MGNLTLILHFRLQCTLYTVLLLLLLPTTYSTTTTTVLILLLLLLQCNSTTTATTTAATTTTVLLTTTLQLTTTLPAKNSNDDSQPLTVRFWLMRLSREWSIIQGVLLEDIYKIHMASCSTKSQKLIIICWHLSLSLLRPRA